MPMVLEEAPASARPVTPSRHKVHPLVLSAKTLRLRELVGRYQRRLEAEPGLDIAAVAFRRRPAARISRIGSRGR